MNLEKLSQPINSQSIEEHEKMLSERMTEIRLEYVDRIFSKKIPPIEDKVLIDKEEKEDLPIDDFQFLLNRYTSILPDLMTCYIKQKKNEGIEWKPEMYDPAVSKFLDKITEFRAKDSEHWIEKTIQLLKEEEKKAQSKEVKTLPTNTSIEEDERRKAGLISFDEDAGYDFWFENSDKPCPIKKEDYCISIHLDSIFKQKEKNPELNLFSSKSLEKLALKIVDEYPETKAIIAESWLLDTPIAERIGFEIYKKQKFSLHGAFWSQFINNDGQIHETRVKKFLETGEAPFQVALGAIMVEDFLKKYLPNDRKGKIILKEINPNFDHKELESEKLLLKEFGKMWDVIGEEELKNFINSNSLLIKFNNTEQGKDFPNFLLEEKRKGTKKEDLDKNPRNIKYSDEFEKFIKSMKLINKEVIIE